MGKGKMRKKKVKKCISNNIFNRRGRYIFPLLSFLHHKVECIVLFSYPVCTDMTFKNQCFTIYKYRIIKLVLF